MELLREFNPEAFLHFFWGGQSFSGLGEGSVNGLKIQGFEGFRGSRFQRFSEGFHCDPEKPMEPFKWVIEICREMGR